MTTSLFAVRAVNPGTFNPFARFGAATASLQQYINWISSLMNPGKAGASLVAAIDQVAATNYIKFAGVSGSGIGATINGIACTATDPDTDDAATAALLATTLNANTTLAAIVLATSALKVTTVTALAQGTPANSYGLTGDTGVTRSGANMSGGVYATGKVLFASVTTGTQGAVIDGITIAVPYNTSATQTAADFAAAVDADATIGPKTTTAAVGTTVTITWTVAESASLANATPLLVSGAQVTVSGATIGTVAGGAVAGVQATGTFTIANAVGRLTTVVSSQTVGYAAVSADDDAVAALVLAKVNAGGNTPDNLLLKNVMGTQQLAVAATGSVNFSGCTASATVGATVKGTLVTVTADSGGDDTATAALFVTAVNTTSALVGYITASRTTGSSRVFLTADVKGTTSNSYGTVASGTGVSCPATTLLGGLSAEVLLAAQVPGYSGNLFSAVLAGTGTTVGGALFTGGLETRLSIDL